MTGMQIIDRSAQEVQTAITGIDRKLTILYNKEIGEEKVKASVTWVTGAEIMKVTGWDANGMRRAREYHYLRYKKLKGGTWRYILESVPERFLIHQVGVIDSHKQQVNN